MSCLSDLLDDYETDADVRLFLDRSAGENARGLTCSSRILILSIAEFPQYLP